MIDDGLRQDIELIRNRGLDNADGRDCAIERLISHALKCRPPEVMTAKKFWKMLKDCEDVDIVNVLKKYKDGIKIIN